MCSSDLQRDSRGSLLLQRVRVAAIRIVDRSRCPALQFSIAHGARLAGAVAPAGTDPAGSVPDSAGHRRCHDARDLPRDRARRGGGAGVQDAGGNGGLYGGGGGGYNGGNGGTGVIYVEEHYTY